MHNLKGFVVFATLSILQRTGRGNGSSATLRYVGHDRPVLVCAQDKARSVPLSALEDTRCDVCLFFVEPHSLHTLDAALKAGLASSVPIVPIIGKVRLPLSICMERHITAAGNL